MKPTIYHDQEPLSLFESIEVFGTNGEVNVAGFEVFMTKDPLVAAYMQGEFEVLEQASPSEQANWFINGKEQRGTLAHVIAKHTAEDFAEWLPAFLDRGLDFSTQDTNDLTAFECADDHLKNYLSKARHDAKILREIPSQEFITKMTDKIIISNEEKQVDIQLEILFSGPLSLLDHRHPAISEELQKKILYDRYQRKLIADGLETGHFFYDQDNVLRFQSKQPIYTFAGFIFEAYAVNVFNSNMRTIGKKAFSWCTNREQCKDDYIDQFKVIGTGFITTKSQFPSFYGPQSTFDLLFIRKNIRQDVHEPATVLGTTNQAGIQIKAITGSEETEIIEPLRTGRYSHVLTFLRHTDGVHSYNRCMEVLNSMHKRGVIQLSEKYDIERRIGHPEMFGIDQREIDDYYQYIRYWHNGQADADQFIKEGVGLEIKGYKYSNGLLIPTD